MTKKVQLFVIWTIFCLLSNLQLNANITPERKDKPESVITSVTVFTDRAMVTRTISRKLNRGEHILVFDNLPEAIEQNSIQATGEGNAVLKDVKFKKEFYTMVTDLEKRDLDNKLIVLQDSVVDANDHITNANKEQKMMEEMLDKIMIRISNTGSDKDMQQPEGNPEKWIKLVDYYRVKLEELNKQVRTTERKIRNYNEEISFLKNKINNLGGYQEKSKNIIEVLIDVSRDESDILVNMSYMVNGPGWYPVYDLRVFTDNRKMDITYQAMVQQNTTEDWDNVNIKLSTARPNVSGDQPSLNPWHLGLYTYEPVRVNDYARNKKAAMSQMYNSVPVPEDDISREIKSDTIQTVAASVETGATAAVFAVPGKNTIKSDNQLHKVTIMMNSFDAFFRYSSVPKLMQYAYLKAKVKNTTDFPLLAGSTNVFLDNNFVSTSHMDLVNPDQEFWTFLGIDEGIEVKYRAMKQYQKDEGVINKKNKFAYDYLIEITSNKKSEEEIVVWDQVPVADSPDIKVTLLEPEIDPNKDYIKMDDNKYIEWFYKIKPKEKLKIPLRFTVEAPKNKTISGL